MTKNLPGCTLQTLSQHGTRVSPQIMLQLEKSDLGCGAGGGQNNVAVFRMAGLTFLTNANADDSEEAGTFLCAGRELGIF